MINAFLDVSIDSTKKLEEENHSDKSPAKSKKPPEVDDDQKDLACLNTEAKIQSYMERMLNKTSSHKVVTTNISEKFEKTKRKLRSYEDTYSIDLLNLSREDFESKLNSIEDKIQSLNLQGIIHDAFSEPKPVVPGLPYKRSEPKKPGLLPVLDDEQWEDTLNKIQRFQSSDPVVNNFRVTVTRAELSTLIGQSWLCDSVINLYMQMLHNRSLIKDINLPKLMVMNTFFFTKFCNDGYRPVMKWTKDKIIFDFDLFIFPVHVKNIHWCLMCVDFRDRTVRYYDSMGSKNNNALVKVKEYLSSEHLTKLKKPLVDIEKFKLINTTTDIPQQENGYDCGVFACTIAEHLSRDVDLKFSQENIPSIRQRMIYEIFNQILLTTDTKFTNKK